MLFSKFLIKLYHPFKLVTPQTDDENLKGAFREYLNWDEEYDLGIKSYKTETDSEFNEDSILIEEESAFETDSEDEERCEDRRITTHRGSESKGIMGKFIHSGIKAVKYLISGVKNKFDSTAYKQRQSRHSKYVPKPPIRTYKYLRQKGTTKRTKKNIPRWAVNKDYLKKFCTYMKENYDACNILGKISKIDYNLCMAKMFDYKTQRKNKIGGSKYFEDNHEHEIDPIDIRGSSAQWNKEVIPAENRFKLPPNLLNGINDSKKKDEYLKENIHNHVKKKIEFHGLLKYQKDSDDMEVD